MLPKGQAMYYLVAKVGGKARIENMDPQYFTALLCGLVGQQGL